MLLRRFLTHFNKQDWVAIALDFVIVVIGIFVGLQASQWNEDRKDRVLEHEYLESLMMDFKSDIEELDKAIDLARMRSRLLRLIHQSVDTGAVAGNPNEFIWAVFNSMLLNYPSYTRTTINDLMSTGNLQLITDTTIKRNIASYYREIDYREQWEPNWRAMQMALERNMPDLLDFEIRTEYQEIYSAGTPFALPSHPDDIATAGEILQTILEHEEADGQIRNMTRIQDLHSENLAQIRQKAVELLNLLASNVTDGADQAND